MAKWFAIVLAAIFALSGVVLGVGSKTGNVFAGCAQSSSSGLSANSSFADRESYLKGQIKKNPNDTDSILQLASLYAGDNVKRYKDAITWYQKYLAIDPKSPQSLEVRLDMGQTYVKMNDTASAIKIDTEATTVDPTNAQAFLELGDVAKGQQNQVAINAWNRYLQLTPNSPYASDIKAEIDTLSHPATAPSTTVPAATPTTGH